MVNRLISLLFTLAMFLLVFVGFIISPLWFLFTGRNLLQDIAKLHDQIEDKIDALWK